jgi:hypothetical protein
MSPTDFAIRRAMDYGQPEKYVYSFLDTSPALHESRRNGFSGMNAVFLLKNGKIMTTDIDWRLPSAPTIASSAAPSRRGLALQNSTTAKLRQRPKFVDKRHKLPVTSTHRGIAAP